MWNNDKLENLSWRLDVKTKSRSVAELNQPTAIVELTIAEPKAKPEDEGLKRIVRFEMDKKELEATMAQLLQIKTKINSLVTE